MTKDGRKSVKISDKTYLELVALRSGMDNFDRVISRLIKQRVKQNG